MWKWLICIFKFFNCKLCTKIMPSVMWWEILIFFFFSGLWLRWFFMDYVYPEKKNLTNNFFLVEHLHLVTWFKYQRLRNQRIDSGIKLKIQCVYYKKMLWDFFNKPLIPRNFFLQILKDTVYRRQSLVFDNFMVHVISL